MAPALLLVNLVATWYLVGLIWLIQIVHYPLFDRVGDAQFTRYEQDHCRLIAPVVGVPMLIELVTAVGLALTFESASLRPAMWLGVAAVIAIWLITAFVSVPCHNALSDHFDAAAHQRLVVSNWARTVLWTARGVGLAWLTWHLLVERGAP